MKGKIRGRFRPFFAPNSLRVQLLFRSLLILAVLLVLIGLLQYMFMQGLIYRDKAASIQSQILSIPHETWQELGINLSDSRFHHPYFFIPGANLAFIDTDGNYFVLTKGPDNINPPRLEAQEYQKMMMKKPGLNYLVVNNAEGVEQLVVLQPVIYAPGQVAGVVQVSTLTRPLKELLIRQLLTFLLLALLAMFIGLLAFLPVLKKTLVPLFNMVETAEQIDAGNLDKRFPTRQGQQEIDRLAESFNGMLERLEASFAAERKTQEQMRQFIADVSHELRTPLTSIHGFLEVLLRGAVNQPEQLQKALVSMHSESERLNALVRDLLLLAKLDRAPHVELAEGKLDEVIREMEPQLRILAGHRQLSLQLVAGLKCKFDADKIKQVVLNLFQNAVQHTDPEQGHIVLSLAERENGVELCVQDNGSGISAEHLPHIFDRFYRSDTSRTRKYGGAGLGLSISKAIVDLHGGRITAESEEGKGSLFRVWLPRDENHP